MYEANIPLRYIHNAMPIAFTGTYVYIFQHYGPSPTGVHLTKVSSRLLHLHKTVIIYDMLLTAWHWSTATISSG